jgi:hypothetical protein
VANFYKVFSFTDFERNLNHFSALLIIDGDHRIIERVGNIESALEESLWKFRLSRLLRRLHILREGGHLKREFGKHRNLGISHLQHAHDVLLIHAIHSRHLEAGDLSTCALIL